jgi:hypothetical protein
VAAKILPFLFLVAAQAMMMAPLAIAALAHWTATAIR